MKPSYDQVMLKIHHKEMNAWRVDYNYWRRKLGEANRGQTFMKKGPIMGCMNMARCELKASMRQVHRLLYPDA